MEITFLKMSTSKIKCTKMQETLSAGLFLLKHKQFQLSFMRDPVLSFHKVFTRGSKYKALHSFYNGKTKVDRADAACLLIYSFCLISILYKSNKMEITFKTVNIIERNLHIAYYIPEHSCVIFSFGQTVCVRYCDTKKLFILVEEHS